MTVNYVIKLHCQWKAHLILPARYVLRDIFEEKYLTSPPLHILS
jgi:hypothetical protein